MNTMREKRERRESGHLVDLVRLIHTVKGTRIKGERNTAGNVRNERYMGQKAA